jgi:hypothetical protein
VRAILTSKARREVSLFGASSFPSRHPGAIYFRIGRIRGQIHVLRIAGLFSLSTVALLDATSIPDISFVEVLLRFSWFPPSGGYIDFRPDTQSHSKIFFSLLVHEMNTLHVQLDQMAYLMSHLSHLQPCY